MTDTLVERRLALQRDQAAMLEQRLVDLLGALPPDARALDAGCGTGALAYAFAGHVADVVGIDSDVSAIAAARAAAPANCTFEVGDATALAFPDDDFSLTGCLRVLHHVGRPDLVVAGLARVTQRGGTVLVVDQLGSVDPEKAALIHEFEHARDESHAGLLTDIEIRGLLEANGLVVEHAEVTVEARALEAYLDLVGLEGARRNRVRSLAPAPEFEVELGWYVARRSPQPT